MLACCIWPALHMWIRAGYISPDRSLVLPDETFLAAERGVRLMWLYRLSQTLKLCCFLFLVIFFFLTSSLSYRTFIWQFDIKQMLWKLYVQCHRYRTPLISMMCPSQARHVEFPSTPWTFRRVYWTVFFGYLFAKCVSAGLSSNVK